MHVEKFKPIIIGAAASLALLLLFGVLQEKGAKFLNLSSQWIFISILPILVSLFVGGYISKFKGFGVELESALNTSVTTSVDLKATDALENMLGDEKQGIGYLRRLSREKAQSIRWLTFYTERKNYYSPRAIERYLDKLISVNYFEVKDSKGSFVCYVPVSTFFESIEARGRPQVNQETLERFITSLENNNVTEEFSDIVTKVSVKSRDSLVNVLRVLRNENVGVVAVISDEGRYLGAAFSHDVEKKVANAVLLINADA